MAFEDICVGQKAVLEVRLTSQLVDAFADLTGDRNPLHTDEAFAKAKGFPSRVAHGLLSAAFFSTIAGTMLPGRDCLLQGASFDFRKPVLIGESLRLEAVVVRKVEAVRTLVMEISARNPAGEVVVSGRLQAGVMS